MLKIDIDIDKNKILKKIKISGHSGFSKKGEDIVCAGVSVLVYSAYLSFKNIADVDATYIDNKNNKDNASLSIIYRNTNTVGELRGITMYLVVGLKAISKEYIKNIKLNIKK